MSEVLKDFVNSLYEEAEDASIRRLDIVMAAETADLPAALIEIIELLPPGSYTRQRLCTQLNSVIASRRGAHRFRTVE